MKAGHSADKLLTKHDSAPVRGPWPIDLAHTRAFRLGSVEVQPSTREAVRGDRRVTLDPKVMEVLVLLSAAEGAILSRDDLITACWGGRAVTDDAVNRVISRLRAVARDLGGFKVETITKVGYRLVSSDAADTRSSTEVGRRQILLGGSAIAGIALAGFAGWRYLDRPSSSEQAQVLIQKGMTSLQANDVLEPEDPGSTLEAIALLTEATRLAPDSAPAWGALALAYTTRKRTAPLAERSGLDSRSRAAADRALKLDPAEERALGAIRLLDPVYRNWAEVEAANRVALTSNPKLPILLFVMSDMLGSVGRWNDAVSFSKQYDRTKFLIPGADRKLLIDLWASGDLQGADAMLEAAVRTWPLHPQIWRARFNYLMFSGRPREVLAILNDLGDRPVELKAEYFEAIQVTAEALAGLRPAAEAVKQGLDYLTVRPGAALQVAQACVALGDRAAAFALFDGYYFGKGAWSQLAPAGGDQDRLTSPLFQPVMSSLWRKPQFGLLLQRIGLENYWRQSGSLPDYRRGG